MVDVITFFLLFHLFLFCSFLSKNNFELKSLESGFVRIYCQKPIKTLQIGYIYAMTLTEEMFRICSPTWIDLKNHSCPYNLLSSLKRATLVICVPTFIYSRATV